MIHDRTGDFSLTCCLFLVLLSLLMMPACGGGTGSTPNTTPLASISVALQPAPPGTMGVTAVTEIAAKVKNDSANGGVTWSCSPSGSCGSFSPTTTSSTQKTQYTAPTAVPSGSKVTVTATSVTDSTKTASANVTITPTPSANFFVSPTGSDSNPGTFSAPFATIAKAQQAVQGILPNQTNSIVVMIRGNGGGTYYLANQLTFTSADSGTPTVNVSWQAYPGESPAISGGMRVTNWTQNGNIWTATLPSNAQYFEQLFYLSTAAGVQSGRRLRARLGSPPNVGTYYRIAGPVSVSASSANCPDLGQTDGFYECYDRFYYTAGDPISSTWTNLSPPPGNPCGAASNAYPAGDIALYSFETMGTSKLLIDCIDTTNDIIYLTGPIRERSSLSDNTTGFIAGHRYLVENVKNELAQPGQWFLDRSISPMTLTYIANSGENPNSDTVIVPQMPIATPQVLTATNLQNVTFQGLTFEHDNFTVPAAGYQYNRLDQNITSAVSCENCQNVTFNGVTITETAGTGIDFTTTKPSSTTTGNTFENGQIFDVAAHGIRIGLLSTGSDTAANVPQLTTVQNNVIEAFGRVFPKGFGIAQGCNHDNTYTHNTIYDGYSSGVNIGALSCDSSSSSFASNDVASFNNIYDLGQGVENDFGCVYFNTTPYQATPPSGNQAMNNVCHDVTDASIVDSDGYGGQGLYIDNYTGLVTLENNLVYRVSAASVAQTCGPEGVQSSPNTIKNNILAFGRQSIKQQGCTPSSSSNALFEMTNNLIIYDRGSVQSGCYSCLGGDCGSVLPATVHFESNMYCYIPGGSCSLPNPAFFSGDDPPGQSGGCHQTTTYATLGQWQDLAGEDSSSVLQNPFSSSQLSSDDYSLSSSPGVGFTPFDASQAGATTSSPPTIPATFPTQSYTASQY